MDKLVCFIGETTCPQETLMSTIGNLSIRPLFNIWEIKSVKFYLSFLFLQRAGCLFRRFFRNILSFKKVY